jgi:hypothetical protein
VYPLALTYLVGSVSALSMGRGAGRGQSAPVPGFATHCADIEISERQRPAHPAAGYLLQGHLLFRSVVGAAQRSPSVRQATRRFDGVLLPRGELVVGLSSVSI